MIAATRGVHIMRACEDSLRRLQTDRIDLYQLHRPDFDVPIDETLGALTDLVRQGKVRYIGSSTAPAWKVLEGVLLAELKGLVPFVTEQPPYNLLDRRVENELVPMALTLRAGAAAVVAVGDGRAGRPLCRRRHPARGSRAALRGGIYADRVSQAAVEAGQPVRSPGRATPGIDPARLAIAWVMHQPAVTAPIIGPRTVEQLEHLLPVMEMTISADVDRGVRRDLRRPAAPSPTSTTRHRG